MKNAITGMITRVQRMSIHDGPGIRTTLFLKGCNFRCRWCHNPETWRRETQVERIGERCVACGACTLVCGSGALRMENGLYASTGNGAMPAGGVPMSALRRR